MASQKDLVIQGDVFAGLNYLQDESIAVAVTSPPYWRQRDYEFEGQIGQEDTPEEYIGRLVAIFGSLRQKMHKNGVFFLNIGDKYFHRYGKSHLLQIPYRLAYHLIKDGWQLEDVIIWYKLNYMPSSVKDRFTNTYEPVLVFTRGKDNIYRAFKRKETNVIRIPLQQTPWKHTAVFPEKLVEELLLRIKLEKGDIVLDPFAGTGTVGAVVKRLRGDVLPSEVNFVLIEKGSSFIDVIRERTHIRNVMGVGDESYSWKAAKEEDLPEIEPEIVAEDRHGEVYFADSSSEFLSALRGISTEEFRSFHRKNALYFFGVIRWNIDDLYYIHTIRKIGYVLRNMLIASNGSGWFPIFMFASDSTRIAYRFYLDRVRVKPKTLENRNWWTEGFISLKVRDISGKRTREGRLAQVIRRYADGFPKIVAVRWDDRTSLELVLHPGKDELLMEGLTFRCPRCGARLEEPYDSAGGNSCRKCGKRLWMDLSSVPHVEEPKEVVEAIKEIEALDYSYGEADVEKTHARRSSRSKFSELSRLNWGASPGARKLIIGEYFTKMRLYRIDQPMIAQYLTLLRKSRGMTIQDVVNSLPPSYSYTVGHWFRQDFGGSIPIPEDVQLLTNIFGIEDGLLRIIERTALKFQTVRTSPKGKNPGDFLEYSDLDHLKEHLRKLYLPSSEYLKSMKP